MGHGSMCARTQSAERMRGWLDECSFECCIHAALDTCAHQHTSRSQQPLSQPLRSQPPFLTLPATRSHPHISTPPLHAFSIHRSTNMWQQHAQASYSYPAESPFELSDIECPCDSPSAVTATGTRIQHAAATVPALHYGAGSGSRATALPFHFGLKAASDVPVPAAAAPGLGLGPGAGPTTNPFALHNTAAAAGAPLFTLGQPPTHPSAGSIGDTAVQGRSRSGSRRTSRTSSRWDSTPLSLASSAPCTPNHFEWHAPASGGHAHRTPGALNCADSFETSHAARGFNWRRALAVLVLALMGCTAFLVGGASLAEIGSATLARISPHRAGAPPPPAYRPVQLGAGAPDPAQGSVGPGRSVLSKDGAAGGAKASSPQSQAFKFVLRILSTGGERHKELSRLLDSIQSAHYVAGVDRLDVEILVDRPAGLTLPRAPAPLPPHATDGEIAAHAVATERATRAPHEPAYLALKYENELTQIVARAFAWSHGQLRVRVVQPSEAPMQSGPLNMLLEWSPSVGADAAAEEADAAADEWALHLRDTSVVSPLYFQAIKRIIRGHFSPSAESVTGATSAGVRLHADALLGAVLEPPETVLGVAEGKQFDATLSPEKLVRAALLKEFLAAYSAEKPGAPTPAFFYTQSLSGFGGGLGGLLLRGRRFAEFKQWLVGLDFIRPLHAGTATESHGQNRGVPVPLVYSRGNTTAIAEGHPAAWLDPCVPGLAVNHWVGARAAQAASLARRGRAWVERAHRERMANPWLPLLLLQRFAYERGLYALQWLPPASTSTTGHLALVSSSAYAIPHEHLKIGHAHAHTNPQGSAGKEHPEQTQGLGPDHEHEVHVPLPPLRRRLVQTDDALWGESRASTSGTDKVGPDIAVAPLLFDISFQAQPLRAGPPASPVPMREACDVETKGAPPQPPSFAPSASELAALQSSLQAQRQKAETAAEARRAREAALLDPHGDAIPTPEEAEIDQELLAMERAELGLDVDGGGGNGAPAKSPRYASSAELVRAAIQAAESHSTLNLTLTAYESGAAGFVDPSTGFPLLCVGGGERLRDAASLFENTTEFEQARWDEYEVDYQQAWTRAGASAGLLAQSGDSDSVLTRVKQQHESWRRAHRDLMAALREELSKKALVESLREQLREIQDQEQEERDDRMAREWREKERKRAVADAKTRSKDKTKGGAAAVPPATPPSTPLTAEASAQLDESLQRKRTTGKGAIESEEEYKRLMVIIRERKRNKQHQPLYLG